MKTTSVLKKLLVKVVDLANSFPAKAERFLYVKKQLRYKDFKKAHFGNLNPFSSETVKLMMAKIDTVTPLSIGFNKN